MSESWSWLSGRRANLSFEIARCTTQADELNASHKMLMVKQQREASSVDVGTAITFENQDMEEFAQLRAV